MNLTDVFKKNNSSLAQGVGSGPQVPDGLLRKCNKCKAAIFTDEVRKNAYICPKCGGYFRMHAYRRIEMLVKPGSFEEWDMGMESGNPLSYKGYPEKIRGLQEKTGLDEAIVTGLSQIGEQKVVLAVCDGRFMMASMGKVVGEKLTLAVERATRLQFPLVVFCCSGGARMQEGIVSLMQMAKTSAALKRHSDKGLLYISVLTNPTTGGVTASFAMLGDIILAEPNALIGFAGPRVIEQTIGQKLPKGFQSSEFLLKHGFVDEIVSRENMKDELIRILDLHEKKENPDSVTVSPPPIGRMKRNTQQRSAWDHVLLSRSKQRPVGEDYLQGLFTDFVEQHGDRLYGDDSAIIGGIARFMGKPVTVIAQAKGHDTKENIEKNFGMPSPEGYRKALRLMKQAEKFHRPVLCIVDTPGAFCGLEAEERGQGEAIARNLYEMSTLATPILSIVIGEGGSGGALAMAVADQVWMLENSIYSILSPEGYASILWKDSKLAKEAAEVMKLTADDLKDINIVETVIPEPHPYTIENIEGVLKVLKYNIFKFIEKYDTIDTNLLIENRYQRFRNL